jgi:endo-1,4-beta-xylanase
MANSVARRWPKFSRRAAARSAAGGVAAASGVGDLLLSEGRRMAAQATPVAVGGEPLWRIAAARGLVFGTSAATWQLSDDEYAAVVEREAAIVFTEDDLLWYQVRTGPEADLNFAPGDEIVGWAVARGKLVLGAHLLWDEGFGAGWNTDPEAEEWEDPPFQVLRGLPAAEQRALLFETMQATLEHYKGRVDGWIVVNEVVDAATASGLRTEDFLWFQSFSSEPEAEAEGFRMVGDAFRLAREIDPDALLILNEFGFETDDEWDTAANKRANALKVVDRLLADGVPLDAFGVQGHLAAGDFAANFDAEGYRAFLGELADRGLRILITELDALDDGLPADPASRDQAIAETYRVYLEAALAEPALGAVIAFGLSDRYTWLQEDYPREDGEPRRPLAFDQELAPKAASAAIAAALAAAPERSPMFELSDATQG